MDLASFQIIVPAIMDTLERNAMATHVMDYHIRILMFAVVMVRVSALHLALVLWDIQEVIVR